MMARTFCLLVKLQFGEEESILAHHHLLELVKVQGATPVLVHLLDDALQVVLGEGAVNLSQNFLENLGRTRKVSDVF